MKTLTSLSSLAFALLLLVVPVASAVDATVPPPGDPVAVAPVDTVPAVTAAENIGAYTTSSFMANRTAQVIVAIIAIALLVAIVSWAMRRGRYSNYTTDPNHLNASSRLDSTTPNRTTL